MFRSRGLGLSFAASVVSTALMLAGCGSAPKTEAPAMTPEEMMAAVAAAGMPGEHHRHLEAFSGSWDFVMTFKMDPSGPEQQANGTSEHTWVMEGRFLQQTVESEFMGEPFRGTAYTGYSNDMKEYQSVWFDSVSTTLYWSTGSCSADGRTLTLKGVMIDPMTGKPVEYRDVLQVVDADHTTMQRICTDSSGIEFADFHIAYTRRR